jgi:hypothetical protein
MLAEFVQAISTQALAGQRVTFHENGRLPHLVYVQKPTGEVEAVPVPPDDRNHTLYGIDDLAAALNDKAIAPRPEVYINGRGGDLTAYLDRDERRQSVTVPLAWSKRFTRCVELETKAVSMSPRDAVKFLRYELHGAPNLETHVIQPLSRLDFNRTSAGKSHVEHGRESLGKSVELSVQQAENVPREFLIAVPIWTTPGATRYATNITCGLFLDLEAQLVEFRVLSDECARVLANAVSALREDLAAMLPEGTPVFAGEP